MHVVGMTVNWISNELVLLRSQFRAARQIYAACLTVLQLVHAACKYGWKLPPTEEIPTSRSGFTAKKRKAKKRKLKRPFVRRKLPYHLVMRCLRRRGNRPPKLVAPSNSGDTTFDQAPNDQAPECDVAAAEAMITSSRGNNEYSSHLIHNDPLLKLLFLFLVVIWCLDANIARAPTILRVLRLRGGGTDRDHDIAEIKGSPMGPHATDDTPDLSPLSFSFINDSPR